MRKLKVKRHVFVLAFALSCLSALSSQTFASGTRINLDNASDLGNAFAGGSALVGDASIGTLNPAGLSFLHKHQLIVSANGVLSNTIFTGSVSAPSQVVSPTFDFKSSGRVTSNSNGLIPAIYYSYPINNKWDTGIGVNVPFGLGLDYGENSILRYSRIKSLQNSYNFGPSLSYRINDHLSVGAGPNIQYYAAEAVVKTNTAANSLGFTDSRSKSDASGWGLGGHVGLLYEVDCATRIGLSYRSQIKANLTGKSIFDSGTVAPAVTTNNHYKLKFMLPANTMLSIYHTLTPAWALMGSIDYTEWSVYNYIRTFNVASLGSKTDVITTYRFHNSWHAALAANYQLNKYWLFRTGVGYDQDAVNNTFRSIDFPNGSVIALAVGGRYMPTDRLWVDVGYLYSFIRSTPINLTDPSTSANTNGRLQTYSKIFGAQVVVNL